jgi:hypothetical protein
MSRFVFALLAPLAFVSTGCQKDSNEQTAYQSRPEIRPCVTLVPVINNTKIDETFVWSLSDEFTSSIFSCLSQGPLYLESLPKVREMVKKCKEPQNPFGTDVSWIKKAFEKEQFVVFLELIKHEEILKKPNAQEIDPKSCSADLLLSMRIRIFDLRKEQPQVVLQEIVNGSHFIPRQFTTINFEQTPWGDDNFNFSPLGLAHWEFTKEIASRIEDYIGLACKKYY